jgi:hypothetical protein
MKFPATLILLFGVTCAPQARVARHPAKAPPLDPSYSSALATANRFLQAWQTQDHETGIMMLTDDARQHASREQLQAFFSPGPEAAYEIKRGHRVGASEYTFPAVLFGFSDAAPHPHVCHIVITKAGKDDWAVDRVP